MALAVAVNTNAQSSPTAMSIGNAIQDLSRAGGPNNRINNGESFVDYHGEREPPKGSRLLFANWPKGFVLDKNDTVLQNPNLFLNFDKITQNLYFTFDGKTIVKVETEQARELHFEDSGVNTILIRVPGIDPHAFYQRLTDSSGEQHYILYRRLVTQLRHADYRTDGLVTTGNNYDEYIDSYEYYLVMPGGREYTPVGLKRRSIREALDHQADAWLATHRKNPPDEANLTEMVNWLNTKN